MSILFGIDAGKPWPTSFGSLQTAHSPWDPRCFIVFCECGLANFSLLTSKTAWGKAAGVGEKALFCYEKNQFLLKICVNSRENWLFQMEKESSSSVSIVCAPIPATAPLLLAKDYIPFSIGYPRPRKPLMG